MIAEIDKRISRALAGVRRVFRAVLGSVNTAGPVVMASGTGLADEPLSDVELMQHFGFTSAPPPGSMLVVVPVGGASSHGVIVATEHVQLRIKGLQTGETAVYNAYGDYLLFGKDHTTTLKTKNFVVDSETTTIKASQGIKLDTPKVEATHELAVAEAITGSGGLAVSGGSGASIDKLDVSGDATIGGKSYLEHTHHTPDGESDPPS
ncbi:phage baseplate assembly protein V [Pandoraea anapnoica]|uniref:Phage baseplate assembly protein V n=1 Tax=Pandoraea anapnoica TaxID=2508301 RepID=A0A5E5AMM4_9BURK|nr:MULTISPECIES: phage baseplate assembly protein V [Pandoraea]VVE14590.1 phage baseplate assembly protein V [Pandoraea iniqua]VVE73340.1 phage baseplate assembly protein V [Pandoraea anapnoica]